MITNIQLIINVIFYAFNHISVEELKIQYDVTLEALLEELCNVFRCFVSCFFIIFQGF